MRCWLGAGVRGQAGRFDDEQVALHEAALNAVGPGPTPSARYLLSSLASELGGHIREGARCRQLIEEAFAIARAIADPALQVDVDWAGIFACWGDRDIRRTLVADLDLVTDRLDPARDLLVAQTRLRVAVSQGELDEARHQLFVEDEILEHTPYALGKWWNQLSHASLEFIEGRLDDADRWNDRALAHATDTGQPDALAYWAGVTSGITRDRATLGPHRTRLSPARLVRCRCSGVGQRAPGTGHVGRPAHRCRTTTRKPKSSSTPSSRSASYQDVGDDEEIPSLRSASTRSASGWSGHLRLRR